MTITTLCGRQPTEPDCMYCLDSYECGELQREAGRRQGGMIVPGDGGK